MKTTTLLIVALKSTKLLKLLKSAKIIKPAISVLSMAMFAVCHSLAMGIAFGVGLLVLLFLHEIGHVLALKQKGFGIKLPFFIPFVGAVVMAPKFDDRHTESYVGYAGPFIGTIAALLCVVPYLLTQQDIWLVLSLMGIILNAFNMLPISPMDGGRITQAIHPWFKYLGLLGLLVFTVALGEPGMLIMWIAVIVDLDFLRFRKRLYGAVGIWVAMFTLTACGAGKNHLVNWIDVGLGAFLVLPVTFFLFMKHDPEKEKELIELEESRRDVRPQLKLSERYQWLFLWLFLLCVHCAFIIWMAPLLPKQ